MRILAIETVGTSGSVAALDDERVVVEERLDAGRRSAQSLAPAIARLLDLGRLGARPTCNWWRWRLAPAHLRA